MERKKYREKMCVLFCAEYALNLRGFSAIDRYMGFPALPAVWAETDADLTALAKTFEELRFPGTALADAALDRDGRTWYFRCRDIDEPYRPSYALLTFGQDCKTGRFQDPAGAYPVLRKLRDKIQPAVEGEPWWENANPRADAYRAAMDAALILARYTGGTEPVKRIAASLRNLPDGTAPCPEEQRTMLTCLLKSARPDLGLELLKLCGFIENLWHELALLDNADHAKEFHPEGNGWKHTMETFRYRKTFDLRLSLGLLLHDAGKPLAKSSRNRRFDGHAELGAEQSRIFLRRLGFPAQIVKDVCFLVRNHMMPAALPRLPLTITREALESPLFPTLLELYRCDEASAFKDLGGYYKSGAAYQAYLRRRKNPYRSSDGKKR
jgi:poly(A) polymerase